MKKIYLMVLLAVLGGALYGFSLSEEPLQNNVVLNGGINSAGYPEVDLSYNVTYPDYNLIPAITYSSQGVGASVTGVVPLAETLYLMSAGAEVTYLQGGWSAGPVIQVNPFTNYTFQAGYLLGKSSGAMVSVGYIFN